MCFDLRRSTAIHFKLMRAQPLAVPSYTASTSGIYRLVFVRSTNTNLLPGFGVGGAGSPLTSVLSGPFPP